MVLTSFLLLSNVATTIGDSNSPLPSADEVVANMMVRDRERQSALNGYTAARRYILENQSHHKRAEMLVRVTCQRDGSKQFETISETGWGGARKYVFRGLLDAEIEASRPELRQRSRVTPENYAFEMMGTEYVNGRPAYVMGIAPKTPNKYLTKGRIWIDAEEYAIVRIEGKPAKNPSFWIKSVHFVHNYEKQGSFWFPVSDVSVTDARIFGNTELTVEYFTYTPTTSAPSAARESVRANLPN